MTSQKFKDPTQDRRQPHLSPSFPQILQPTSQPTCQSLDNCLECLDFNHFFERFDIDSPVSKYFEMLSLNSLWELMGVALTSVFASDPHSPSPRSIKRARLALDDELERLDTMLKLVQGSRLRVEQVRETLQWVRGINRIMLDSDFLDHVHDLPTTSQQPSQRYQCSSYHDNAPLPYWERYPNRSLHCARGYCGQYSISRSLTGKELLAKIPSGHAMMQMINSREWDLVAKRHRVWTCSE